MRVDAVSTNRATSCDDLMNRTGADLEISLSRLYHLEMASSASSEAPRRPSDTPKCFCGPNLARGWHRIRSWAAKRPDRGAARRAKSTGPLGAPTGRSAIISPEATSTGRSAPRVKVFSTDTRTLFAQPNRPISSPLRRLGPSPWDPGPGAGQIDRP